jgi:hypothetical protein
MSLAARKRIVAAQKARWAKWRKAQKKTQTPYQPQPYFAPRSSLISRLLCEGDEGSKELPDSL